MEAGLIASAVTVFAGLLGVAWKLGDMDRSIKDMRRTVNRLVESDRQTRITDRYRQQRAR